MTESSTTAAVTSATTTLRIGISPCPNDVYLWSGVLLGAVPTNGLRFDWLFEDVENLNRHAQNSDLDVVKISYANYPRCAGAYELLSCGGALGRGVGPLLLTGGAPWDPDREVLVPGQFTTANFLLDFWAGRALQRRFVVFDALYEALRGDERAQGVVIHEKRFTYAADGLRLVQDLGEYWEARTGFAIPLGAVIVRRERDLAAPVASLIRASLDWADAHRDDALALCRRYAQDLNPEVVAAHVALYVNEYSRDLGADGQAAVDFFLERQQSFPPTVSSS